MLAYTLKNMCSYVLFLRVFCKINSLTLILTMLLSLSVIIKVQHKCVKDISIFQIVELFHMVCFGLIAMLFE